MKHIIAAILIISVIISGTVPITVAQENVQPAPGGTTVHVVQRDETLYRIALRYGTTIEAIAEANGIADPRYIAVGQRLLIPNAQFNAPGALITHQVMPGESVERLALTYQTTADQIASANFITNPALIYAGQDLMISQGATENTVSRTLHRVQSGETWPTLAVMYNVRLNKLLEANNGALTTPVFPHQRLWIPRAAPDTDATDLPLPLTDYALTPIPAVQGQTISIHIATTGPATLSGTFMGYPIQFVTQDANHHFALFGIHAFAASGVFPMRITILEPDGTRTAFTGRVRVDEGGYGTETISLDTQQNDLLNPQVTEPEWERVATMMSAFTSQRYFDGLMGLPSTGAITSQFGTRRAYNGGRLDSFHSGTDFAGGPGSAVVAPAAGVVILAEELPVRGSATIIDHGWGVVTGYWHQSEIYVAVGDVISAGHIIGTVGSTGRSTGPHLHWEMWIGGVQVDPMQWVQQRFP